MLEVLENCMKGCKMNRYERLYLRLKVRFGDDTVVPDEVWKYLHPEIKEWCKTVEIMR